jgi:hypothetical protein
VSELTLTTDEAMEFVYDGAVAKQFVSDHRWYTTYLIVFPYQQELRGFYYDEPATEEQEGMDRFDSYHVVTFPVVAKQITTTVYEPVKEEKM